MRKIISIAVVLALLLSVCMTGCQGGGSPQTETADEAVKEEKTAKATSATYAESLFDTSFVHEINVEIGEDDWEDLLANPLKKTKYAADVTIDGNRVENVSFATKGNTSLSQVASSDSDRYSFKINFGKFEKGQTYQGLDKLNLNNIMSDATYMKDYLSYMIMREAGVSASLTSYVSLSVNGRQHGLYIAVEDVSDSFLERNYQNADGALYKPETERLDNADGGPGQKDGQMPQGDFQPPTNEDGSAEMPQGDRQRGGPQGMDGDSKGADLVYSDDERDSYSDIFDNEENDVTEEDEKELIAAVKALNSGGNVEQYWDMDAVIRYFAAHNFVLNYDSYTGTMLHNYYLYETDGKVTVLPWDYNLAFGGFQGGSDATSAVNWAIDSPLSGTTEEKRPLWNAIVSNETYLEKYHQYYRELLSKFFDSGRCSEEIERVSGMIRSYVENDPTAFYTVDEFDAAVSTLKSFCEKRAESIGRQLDGKLGSTADSQKSEEKVDASDLTLSKMGTQGGGKDGEGGPGGPGGQPGGAPPSREGQPQTTAPSE